MTDGQYSVNGGFWAMPQAAPTKGAPTLIITKDVLGFATLSWWPASTNLVLQENLNLGSTNWVNSPSGTTNPITVLVTVPTNFYQLLKLWS
jgi:hypothetical protein